MAEFMDFVKVWIEQIIATLGYPGVALVMLIENLFPPIPSELVMPFGGFLVVSGEFSFVGIMTAGTIGSVAGAVVLYYIGMWADEPVIRRVLRRYGRYFQVSETDLDRALGFFAKYGEAVVFFGRLIPLIRSLISLPAGMKRMPMPRFLLFTTLGTVLWNLLLTYSGMVLGANWTEILVFIERYQRLTLATIVIAVIAFLAVRIVQRRKARARGRGVEAVVDVE